MTKGEIKRFAFRMPSELLGYLKKESNKKGVSVNALILEILWNWSTEETSV